MLTDSAAISVLGIIIGVSSGAVAIYVRSSMMELRAEFNVEISTVKEEIIKHINTSYVRKENCVLREDNMKGILDRLRQDIDKDAQRRSLSSGL